MENYEKKYKESIERMKSWVRGEHPECFSEAQKAAEFIFPELKESEDERIRKEIIDFLGLPHPQFVGKRDHEKWIAWLEKQGEKKDYYTKQELIDMGFSFTLNGDIVTPDKMMEDMKKYLAWKEKHDEQKQADTPKFKVGDFIANDYCSGKVIEITNDAYLLDTGQGIPFSCEHNAHLWTIEDAKDGDILVCNINKAEIGGDVEKLPNMTPTICIYQNVVKDSDYIHSYCSLYDENSLVLQNTMYYNAFVCNIHPATKEQRDLLFQKMKEEGCEWDSEKKELKKIESKALDVWNAEDEQNINVVLSFIPDECLRRWLKDKLCYDTLDANKVIEWLTANVRLYASLNFLYGSGCPQEDIEVESLIKSFKKDFGL